MIADGVAQGYSEAQVAAKAWRARGGPLRRGWARTRAVVRRQPVGDWASDLAALSGQTRRPVAIEPRHDPALARSAERFRADIERARAEAIAFARGRVAHA